MAALLLAREIKVYEGVPALFVARIETAGGTPLVQANINSFSVTVFDLDSDTPIVSVYSLGALDPAIGYYDALQYDDAANLLGDDGGYNFKYVISADEFTFRSGRHYRVQVISSIGGSFHVQVYTVNVGDTFS